MYKHSEDSIDPRDKDLISFNPETKIFVAELSSLRGAGIEVQHHYGVGGNYYFIWMWSEKLSMHILYKENRQVKSPDGEIIADVFIPYFSMKSSAKESKAEDLSLGTELHILND